MTSVSPVPGHGQERDRRLVTREGSTVTYTTPDGQVAYSGPSSSVTETQCERYCASCAAWKPQRGILARIFGCPDCKRSW